MKNKGEVPPIVLASASPKRKELLEMIGLSIIVDPSDCAETKKKGESPLAFVRRVSLDKARCVAARHPNSLIIAADTIGAIGRQIFGKAGNVIEARATIQKLSGRTHLAITGTTIIDTTKCKEQTFTTQTRVTFRRILPDELEWFLDSGEWRGKAACYTLVGKAATFIQKIDGDIGTVLGLSLSQLTRQLRKMGYSMQGLASPEYVISNVNSPNVNSPLE
ncbi:septum formation protein Maf [Candidatus Uhrbacteria bacterium]|nr:septum formation protein Maf [Candidatus Uhrbacteria bacterium]